MLHTLADLDHYIIKAVDGVPGIVTGFYCEDQHWQIDFLIVELGNWASSYKVLIAPTHIKEINRENKTFSVSLSVEEIRNSSPAQTQKFVLLESNADPVYYHSYPGEWSDIDIEDSYSSSTEQFENQEQGREKLISTEHLQIEPQIRTCDSLITYQIEASDGQQGYLEGMLIDEENWIIRYFIVNTSQWWLGHQVLISPQLVKSISDAHSQIYVQLTRQQVLNCPRFDTSIPKNWEEQSKLQLHYGRDGYSESEEKQKIGA